ncbi:MAG TPA: signal peptidase II [Gemmatimonadaceae bacterium]|nr:signal peptidase II [Gemmatimonadaceae bacterium]
MSRTIAARRSPVTQAAAVAAAVVIVDLVTKVAAVALLGGRHVPLPGGAALTVVYNDSFARGMALGPLTLPATLALTGLVLAMAWRVCAPLARLDAIAPTALGLLAGAAIGNAADFVRTGLGAVDFLAVPTADGAIVFNLADVAAYLGVVLLARTALVLARAAAHERRTRTSIVRPIQTARGAHAASTVTAARTARRAPREVPVAVPLFVEGGGAPAAPLRQPLAHRGDHPLGEEVHLVERRVDVGRHAQPAELRVHDRRRDDAVTLPEPAL